MLKKKESIIKDTVIYSASNYVSLFIGFFVSVLMKRFLGPMGAGYWALINVIRSYGGYFGLGVKKALNREIPQSIGAGKPKLAKEYQDAAFSFLLLSAFCGAVFIFILSYFLFDNANARTATKIAALLVLSMHMYNLVLTILRSRRKFSLIGRVIIANSIFVLIFAVPGAYFLNIRGVALGMVISTASTFFLAKKWAGLKFSLDFDWQKIGRLIGIGSPMLLLGMLFTTFINIDRIMIGKMLGMQMLGLYSIAIMSITHLDSLPKFFNIVIFPHIQENYGATNDILASKNLILKSIYFVTRLVPFILGLIIFGVQLLVYYVLPQFKGGLGAMNILVFGYFFMVVNHASTNVIYTINKQRKLIPFYAVSVCFSIALNYLFIKAGFGIRGVALATAISYLIFYLVNFSYALKHIISWGKLLRLHAEIAGYFIYFLAGIVTINRFVILNNMLLETIIRVVCLVVLTLPVFIEIQVRERFFSLLFASISPYFTRKKV